ncbi:FAD-binding monooxygenase, partial [Ramicandelaber brevisporus]
RVVIAGDAAHCHGPAGGQGLNLGMQDAFDLAWKLALVLNCGADRRVMLATYEQERRLVAGRVLQ